MIEVDKILDGGHVALVFYSDATLVSEMIRAWDHGAYSHVDCLMPDGRRLGALNGVYDGVPKGVQIRPPGYYAYPVEKVVALAATPEQQTAFYAFLERQLGKPYDLGGLVANFIADRDWRQPDSWWCSELAGAALEPEAAGVFPFRLGTPLNRLSPDGLFLACSAIADVAA